MSLLLVSTLAFPQLPPGVDPASCPNYPFCGESPAPAAPAAPAANTVSIRVKERLTVCGLCLTVSQNVFC